MDFYNELKKLSDEDITKLVEYRIKYLEDIATLENARDYVGYNIDHRFSKHELENNGGTNKFDLDMVCFYPGYIKEGVKVIYGIFYDTSGNASNNGHYYYIDTHDYITEFCKMIVKEDIVNEQELFQCILEYLKNYYGYFEKIDRGEMFKLLRDNNDNNIGPKNEHGLSWFKGMGNALCTEYSIMAQNILSVFGINSYLVIGEEKVGKGAGEGHAFNLLSLDDNDILIDFSNYVKIYDIDFSLLGIVPFIGEIDELNQDFVDRFLGDEKHLVFEDYNYLVIGDVVAKIAYDRNRDYYFSSEVRPIRETKYVKKK